MGIKRITLGSLAIDFTMRLAFALAPLRAAGTTYYVATNGNDCSEGNLIQDINVERNIGGAETAGIKLHWAIDTVLRNNIIRRVYNAREGGQNFGLWLDFCNQGARVTGNVIYDIIDPAKASPKCFPLYLEANVGPIVVDNNILLKHAQAPYNNELATDIIGQAREAKAGTVVPGPFAKLEIGRNSFRFMAGSTSSAFVSTERK